MGPVQRFHVLRVKGIKPYLSCWKSTLNKSFNESNPRNQTRLEKVIRSSYSCFKSWRPTICWHQFIDKQSVDKTRSSCLSYLLETLVRNTWFQTSLSNQRWFSIRTRQFGGLQLKPWVFIKCKYPELQDISRPEILAWWDVASNSKSANWYNAKWSYHLLL